MHRLFFGCRHADAEGAVGPSEMHTLPCNDLGSEKGVCHLAQSLSLVRETRRGAKRDEAAQIQAVRVMDAAAFIEYWTACRLHQLGVVAKNIRTRL